MPRLIGQIDRVKNEAILDAAVEVLSERGLAAPIDEVARRANVSKQTIYNHYGSKAELVRAVAERRADEIRVHLRAGDAGKGPAEALAAYGRLRLETFARPRGVAFMRLAVAGAAEAPDVARALYEAGTLTNRLELAAFIALENAAGRLDAPDPLQAAEFFGGMVIGSYQTAALLGVALDLTDPEIDRVAREAAERFMRAYRRDD